VILDVYDNQENKKGKEVKHSFVKIMQNGFTFRMFRGVGTTKIKRKLFKVNSLHRFEVQIMTTLIIIEFCV
jgi:hypothetical protein